MKVPKSVRNWLSTPLTVDQLKRYGYSAMILFGVLSMSTVLLFGSPTFALSPVMATFDLLVYPVFIILSLLLVRAILTGKLDVARFEKPIVIVAAVLMVAKYSLTILAAPSLVSLAYSESWYWMMIGVWTISFLAYRFIPGLLINLSVYIASQSVTVVNVWLRSEPGMLFDRLSDLAASNMRLGTTLLALIILGYVKEQWVSVEHEAMQLRTLAHKDPLTGLPNRRLVNTTLHAAMKGSHGRVSVVLFDLDGFKGVNDRLGHAAGDEVLRQIGRIAQEHVRPQDTIGRWGGEEFLMICPDTTLDEAVEVAEELRNKFASHTILGDRIITGSFGVAERLPNESAEHLVARADQALYAAKERGRNRVIAWGSEALTPSSSPL